MLQMRLCLAVRAAGTTGLGAGPQSLFDNGLERARATSALGAAAEAAIDLLRIAREVRCSIYSIADVMVAKHVAGTNDHEICGPFGDAADPSILKPASGCKRKSRAF